MQLQHFIDTRGAVIDLAEHESLPESELKTFSDVVIEGLAAGGGLYVPVKVPEFEMSTIKMLAKLPYAKRAGIVYKAFQTGFAPDAVDEMMERAYGENFDDPQICPITSFDDGMHVLELWHGPTSAFKDMALQCLPLFFSASIEKQRAEGKLDDDFLILVATSGDTGKAALQGFAGVDHVKIAVLYPDGGVSDIQRKQMITQDGDNVCVWAVEGNFDDCQSRVKEIFADKNFAAELHEKYKIALSSANSINWGRLLPQIVYYISSYSVMMNKGIIAEGDPIDVCVPTGNFGNILAAWYARWMGVPIGNLICASNTNRILTDFITTGVYDISDRAFELTASPSMDILISSNLERQLFELTGRNTTAINQWMSDLREKKRFKLDPETRAEVQANFKAGSVDDAATFACIKRIFDERGYLLDPHTAVAWAVAEQFKGDAPMLVVSTAHWAKFGINVYRALHEIAPGEALPAEVAELTDCQLNARIAEECGLDYIPAGLADLDEREARFSEVIDASVETIKQHTCQFLES